MTTTVLERGREIILLLADLRASFARADSDVCRDRGLLALALEHELLELGFTEQDPRLKETIQEGT